MTAVAVTFDGTRVNASDVNTNWGKINAGGGAPAAEAPIAYQNSLAVNNKVNNAGPSNLGGIDYDPAASALDMTAAANRLWFVKANVADSFDLYTSLGCECWIGSGNGAYYNYVMSGTSANLSTYNAYPAQGGYLITAIDPNIAAWREGTTGSPSLTAVDYFAFVAQFTSGSAKSENVALDAIDVGTGLTLLNGTGADPAGTYPDFVAEDQDDTTNRWGVVVGSGDNVRAIGLLTTGASGTATEFDDSTSIVTFPDGYHSRGLLGVDMNIENASSVIADGALLIGQGTRNGVDANDTRPDYTVTGTSGSYTFTGQMRNFRDVTFTSICDVNGDIECHLLVQNSANIENAIIRCNSLTSVACLQDPTFGTTTDLNNTTFIQSGAGHALEIDTAGDYTATNIEFSGFNAANSQPDSAIDVTAGTGTVNITVSGGASANYTYNSAGATVNILTSVLVTINVVDEAGNDVNSAQTSVYLTSDDTQVMNEDTVSGTATEAFTGSTPAACYIRVRKGSTGTTKYIPASTTGTIESSTGLTTTVVLREDGINAT